MTAKTTKKAEGTPEQPTDFEDMAKKQGFEQMLLTAYLSVNPVFLYE